MKFVEQIERLQYLDNLIRKGNTGTPDELANRLGISRSQLYNLISYLNEIGMEIKYFRHLNSFRYDNSDLDIEIQFSIKIITNQKAQTIYGGGFVFLLTSTKTNMKGYELVWI